MRRKSTGDDVARRQRRVGGNYEVLANRLAAVVGSCDRQQPNSWPGECANWSPRCGTGRAETMSEVARKGAQYYGRFHLRTLIGTPSAFRGLAQLCIPGVRSVESGSARLSLEKSL